ncbi:MAG TPA: cytochrome c [Methylomirabilota bacterium]|jgi:mono/diheme cytochrome c family protein|nr:cytochrome c [Methylomirabilota bacterium]
MARRLILGGAVAVTALLAVSALSTPAWAQAAQAWNCPAAEKAKKNPVPKTDAAVAAGKKHTVDKACTACHGESGKGDGPGAAALNPKPADWTSAKVQQESDGCIFWKITTGRGAMPPWAAIPENERWQIIHYIRTLKK